MLPSRTLAAVIALAAASAFAQAPPKPFAPKSTKTAALAMTGLGGTAPTPVPFRPKVSKTEPLAMTGLGGGKAPGAGTPFTPRSTKTQSLTMTGVGK